MTRTRRQAIVAAMVMAITMSVAGRAKAHTELSVAPREGEATVVLYVVNYAALSQDILDATKVRVAIVYERIGVTIVWMDGERSGGQSQDDRLRLSVLLLSRNMAERKIKAEGIKDGVFGNAHLPSGRASIFCDRIAATPGRLSHLSIALSDVIAHEVGHLLLGQKTHSRSGIMRANIDVRALHLQSFDETQAHTIRTMLMEPRSVTSRR